MAVFLSILNPDSSGESSAQETAIYLSDTAMARKVQYFRGLEDMGFELTPTLQKSRMPQILGVEGEAVVLYREPSTTQEMRYHRLSRRVNKMAVFSCFQHATCSEFQQSIKNEAKAYVCSF